MQLLTKLRHIVEYLALRLVIFVFRLIPLDRAVPLSAKAWRKLAPLGKRRHRRALANLARAFPEKSAAEREEIALAAWANLGRIMVETMQLDRIMREPERIEIVNAQVMERYRGKLGSMVCCSLHMGNWELATWPLVVVGANPAAVYRIVTNPYVEDYLRSQRGQLYTGGMFSRGGRRRNLDSGLDTARQLGSYLRQGGRIGMLADLHDKHGIEVPFFGHPAQSTSFPAMLARRIGSRLFVGRCIRVGELSRFKVEMKEIRVPFSDDKDEDMRQVTAAVQRQFEDWIREYPEQWMWSNRRWGDVG
jgi:KDO2-lipid IV(A) lauroyltransferase